MAEWSIAAVLKTVDPKGSGGSNPSLSAKGLDNDIMSPMGILDSSPSGSGDLDGFGLTIGLVIAFGSIAVCVMHVLGIYF